MWIDPGFCQYQSLCAAFICHHILMMSLRSGLIVAVSWSCCNSRLTLWACRWALMESSHLTQTSQQPSADYGRCSQALSQSFWTRELITLPVELHCLIASILQSSRNADQTSMCPTEMSLLCWQQCVPGSCEICCDHSMCNRKAAGEANKFRCICALVLLE